MKCKYWDDWLKCYGLVYYSNDMLDYKGCNGQIEKCPKVHELVTAKGGME
jgi:hypothetical protein